MAFGYSAQHCLLCMIEKIRKIKDSEGFFAAIITDLSKAFDCISHELLLTKLHAYGFDKIINFYACLPESRATEN